MWYNKVVYTPPISSYGIILFYDGGTTVVSGNGTDNNNTVTGNGSNRKFLIYQQRDTYSYVEFVRGMWTSDEHIYNMLSLMTKDEKQRLVNYTFDELWEDLWISKFLTVYKDGKSKSKRKFESIDVKKYINNLEENAPLSSFNCDLPWGFPKGRLNDCETIKSCAMREFFEETGIPLKNITVWSNGVYTENYIGHNNKMYQSIYFIASTDTLFPIEYMDILAHVNKSGTTYSSIRKKTISDEAGDMKWVTLEESALYLNPRRHALLKKINNELGASQSSIVGDTE